MKSKRAIIISSAIMALALIVTIVGVSAAWFGDVKHASTQRSELYVWSDHPEGDATIDFSSSLVSAAASQLVPAKAVNNWLLGGHTVATGEALKTANVSQGIQEPATVAPVYFPFRYDGTADSSETLIRSDDPENPEVIQRKDDKKAIKIYIDTAYLKANGLVDESVNYIDEFFITFSVVQNVSVGAGGVVSSEVPVTSVNATPNQVNTPTALVFDSGILDSTAIYYISDEENKVIYMLVPPFCGLYHVKVQISYNYVDEELNPKTINKTISFGVHIQTIERSDFTTAVLALLS